MTPVAFLNLALSSLTAPRDVARLLLSLRLGREALILAFALVIVLNALVYGVSLHMTPLPPEATSAGDIYRISPLIFMLALGVALAGTIFALTWAGRAMGGAGGIADVAVLLIWMQALRVLVQIVMVLTAPFGTGIAALLVIFASAAGVWMLVHFLDEAHGFGNLTRALVVMLLGITGAVLGLALFLSLMGATTMGLTANV